jgi:hypothetical protein
MCFEKGRGVGADAKRAVEWLQRAAAQGHAEAQCWLGTHHTFFFYGFGGFASHVRHIWSVCGWLVLCDALSEGRCYGSGRGVSQDLSKAVEGCQRSAEQGYAHAQCDLGTQRVVIALCGFALGGGDFCFCGDESVTWICHGVGVSYAKGEGVAQDAKKAAWLQRWLSTISVWLCHLVCVSHELLFACFWCTPLVCFAF